MSQAKDQREKCMRQYIAFRVKVIEFMHLFLIMTDFNEASKAPDNVLGHNWKHFAETLLHTIINHFFIFTDYHKDGLNIRRVWSVLFPNYQQELDLRWQSRIEEGWQIIRKYRDNAGSHSGNLEKFIEARGTLMRDRKIVIRAIREFLDLAIYFMKRESEELADFPDFIETTLLDIELRRNWSLNRRWLRDWKLLESGNFSKRFP